MKERLGVGLLVAVGLLTMLAAPRAAGPAWASKRTAAARVEGPGIPTSMAALGDSLTSGFGADGRPDADPARSWATGSDPAVESHYLRLLARTPFIVGRAGNYARVGARMVDLLAQAEQAVHDRARYVTIWAGTNDVCTATSEEMTAVADVAADLRAVLERLTGGIPGVRVLVLSVPDWVGLWERLRGSASAQEAWTRYPDRCLTVLGPFAGDADRAAAALRIADLNAALSSVCREFPACADDGGAVYRLWPSLTEADFSFDLFHLSAAGQARVAEVTWNAGPCAPPPRPSCVHAAPPVIRLASGGDRVVRARPWHGRMLVQTRILVDQVSLLKVSLSPRRPGEPLPLLAGSAVGSARSGRLRRWIYARGVGALPVRLLLPPIELRFRSPCRLTVEATGLDGLRSRLVLPVRTG